MQPQNHNKMAKKRFNVSSTLKKKEAPAVELAKPIPLKKTEKNLEEVKEAVEEIHEPVVQPTPAPEIAKPAPTKTRAKRTAKKSVPETPQKLVRLTIDTPEEMHKQLKVKAVLSGISMRDFILKLIEKELKK